ncbi:Na(+)/H(+) antiporter subunit C [Streptomyces sp. DSM 44915]|uniref:Na(+)/H(+) antiporter subunit C n=1 Tax=Streptomyces chisholmiae TaxID=3075540 RepID=A0ABU2JTB1_9ACTN|nr:Na(+)/H(+) antiporter subunit C [Streptomyces sp. DSM 44915]MDT0267996.1 Na(+)/H(+) antiporter subunit C [Streptomyces sp. DSM 44915]
MTTLDLVMAVTIGALFAAGFYLLLDRSLMRVLLGVIVLGHAANLLLLTGGPSGVPPVVPSAGEGERYADPLPQAMALTAIVITFAITTLLLALVHRAWQLDGHDEVRDDVEDRRIGTVQDREESGPPLPTDRDHEPGGGPR